MGKLHLAAKNLGFVGTNWSLWFVCELLWLVQFNKLISSVC